MKIFSFLPAVILPCAVFCLMISAPALSIDQIIKLYICQTEHDLDEIVSWENTAPEKYRQATKNGKLTPLEAARESAGYFVGNDKIQCNSDNKLVIDRSTAEGGQTTAYKVLLSGPKLAAYCPQTIKKYGNLCAP